jgi:hypothetical protein
MTKRCEGKAQVRSPLLACLLTLSVPGLNGVLAQGNPPLGPKDGPTVPATDLDRVKVGDEAPDFTLESLDGRRITLSSHRSNKNVILVFYRGHW